MNMDKKENETVDNNDNGNNISLVTDVERDIDIDRPKAPLDALKGFVSLFSIWSFWWINSLVVLGKERALLETDIWDLPNDDHPTVSSEKFYELWTKEYDRLNSNKDKDAKIVTPTLWKVLGKLFLRRFILAGLSYIVAAICQISLPFLISAIIQYVEDSQNPSIEQPSLGYGFAISFGLYLITIFVSLCINHNFYHGVRMGSAIRSLVMVVVYHKALRLSALSKQLSSTGETVNLMSADSQRLFEMTILIHFLWIPGIIIIVIMALLYLEIGAASFAGVGLMLLLIPIQGRLARRIGQHRRSMLKYTDDRVNVITEILNGIRVVKFYAWERPFSDRVDLLRSKEVDSLMWLHFMKAINFTLIFVWPVITALGMFALYVLLGNELDTNTAFTVLALMNVIRFPIALLPMALAACAEGIVSLKRLSNFFAMDELQHFKSRLISKKFQNLKSSRASIIQKDIKRQYEHMLHTTSVDERLKSHEQTNTSAIEVQNGDFRWDKNIALLENINLNIKSGSLVAIVGSVGTGKSSLLSSLIGETHCSKGTYQINGRVAYMSQESWIRNATVRDNVLFGLQYEEKRYHKAIFAAALIADLKMLPSGDLTEIGERGINLSGGQKARVCLARAVYRSLQCDVFLLDDPFSAVDVNVGKHMFKHAILRALDGKTRVIILNSHLHFLKQFDHIIIMDKISDYKAAAQIASQIANNAQINMQIPNTIVANGSYNELIDKFRDKLSSEHKHENESNSKLTGKQERAFGSLGLGLTNLKRQISSGSDSEMYESSQAGHTTDDTILSNIGKKVEKKENKGSQAKLIIEEDRETGSVQSKVWLSYLDSAQLFGPNRLILTLFVLAVIYLIAQTGRLFSDYWLALWADKSWNADKDNEFWLGIYAIVVAATLLVTLFRSLLFVKVAVSASRILHENLFTSLLRAPTNLFFDVTPVGRIINRFSKDLDHVDVLLPDFMAQLLQNSLHLAGAFVLICISTPWFLILLLPILYLFVTVQNYFRYSSREIKRLESLTRSPIFSSFGESLNGLSTIRAFKMHNTFEAHNQFLVNRNARVFFAFNFTNRWLAVRLDFLAASILGSVAIFAVILRESANPSLVGLALIYSQQFTGLLQWTVRLFIETENNMTAVERLRFYADVPQEAPAIIPQIVDNEWPQHGAISFRNLKMRYREGLPLVLNGIDCEIEGHQKIGVVGRTGSGKSSLMIALFRMVEPVEKKSIYIDGIDISTIGLETLRSRLAIIPQDPVLFSGTIKYNLDPFGETSDELLWQALERVHLSNIVKNLEGKLEARVAEYGENFSQGQRQLICIARALLRNAKIIVMDEATASIDTQTDKLIQQTMRQNFSHATVLTIAHRIDTIIDYDRVLVLDKGTVAEYDTPKKLYDDNGIFGQMCRKAKLKIN